MRAWEPTILLHDRSGALGARRSGFAGESLGEFQSTRVGVGRACGDGRHRGCADRTVVGWTGGRTGGRTAGRTEVGRGAALRNTKLHLLRRNAHTCRAPDRGDPGSHGAQPAVFGRPARARDRRASVQRGRVQRGPGCSPGARARKGRNPLPDHGGEDRPRSGRGQSIFRRGQYPRERSCAGARQVAEHQRYRA